MLSLYIRIVWTNAVPSWKATDQLMEILIRPLRISVSVLVLTHLPCPKLEVSALMGKPFQIYRYLQYLYDNRILILKNWMYCFAWLLNDSISRHACISAERIHAGFVNIIILERWQWKLPYSMETAIEITHQRRCGEVQKIGVFTRNPLVFHQFHR